MLVDELPKNTFCSKPYSSDELLAFLSNHSIIYSAYYHEAVFTCEQAEKNTKHLPGIGTKNLFLTTKSKDKFFV